MKIGQKFFQLKAFVNHFFSRTHVQVLHSPFVFDLYTKCIRGVDQPELFEAIEHRRQQLLKDATPLSFTDAGAGTSAQNKSIRTIARHSLKPAAQAGLLYRLVNYFKPEQVLELGTSLGISAAYMAQAGPKKITTIEGITPIAQVAKSTFSRLNLEQTVDLRTGLFDDELLQYLSEIKQVDFVFIDGNHRYEPTVKYFHMLAKQSHNGTVLVFDDIHWSAGMEQAWEFVKQDNRVTVTVDLYYLGLVFFRKEQVKQHFCLRF